MINWRSFWLSLWIAYTYCKYFLRFCRSFQCRSGVFHSAIVSFVVPNFMSAFFLMSSGVYILLRLTSIPKLWFSYILAMSALSIWNLCIKCDIGIYLPPVWLFYTACLQIIQCTLSFILGSNWYLHCILCIYILCLFL